MKTRAETVVLKAGQKLRAKVLSISDDSEFDRFRGKMFREHNVMLDDLCRVAGIDNSYLEEAGFSVRLASYAEHGDPDDPDSWWLENCPAEYRIYLLEKALNDPFTAIYHEVLGREPDAEGLAFWRGYYNAGMPLSEIIRYIETSPEARGSS